VPGIAPPPLLPPAAAPPPAPSAAVSSPVRVGRRAYGSRFRCNVQVSGWGFRAQRWGFRV